MMLETGQKMWSKTLISSCEGRVFGHCRCRFPSKGGGPGRLVKGPLVVNERFMAPVLVVHEVQYFSAWHLSRRQDSKRCPWRKRLLRPRTEAMGAPRITKPWRGSKGFKRNIASDWRCPQALGWYLMIPQKFWMKKMNMVNFGKDINRFWRHDPWNSLQIQQGPPSGGDTGGSGDDEGGGFPAKLKGCRVKR